MRSSLRQPGRMTRSAALATAGVLAASVFTALPAAAADGTPYDHESACADAPPTDRFTDRPTTPGRTQTNVDCASRYVDASENILLAGAPDGFSPAGDPQFKANLSGTSSRAQFAKILNVLGRIANIENVAERAGQQNTFPDVAKMNSTALRLEIQGAWEKGLMNGTNQPDAQDVDGDGDKDELLFDPNGTLPYTQAITAVVNLLERAEGKPLSSAPDGKNSSNGGLDCKFANSSLDNLVNNSIIHISTASNTSITPSNCSDPATRGEVYDLFLSAASYLIDKGEMAKATFEVVAPTPTNNNVIAVSPATDGVVPVSTATDTAGVRTFTVTGLDDAKEYDLALFRKADLVFDADGNVRFSDSNSDNFADRQGDTTAAVIRKVNGAQPTTSTAAFNTSPINGKITVEVDSTSFDQVRLVVWMDTGTTTNDKLDLVTPTTANAEPKLPKDTIGVGGLTTWIPEEAASGAFGPVVVQYLDKTGDFFVAGGQKYRYKSNDTFTYDSDNKTSTFSQFEQALGLLDILGTSGNRSEYSQDFGSTLRLIHDHISMPTAITMTAGNFDGDGDLLDVKFNWMAPNPADGLIEKYAVTVETDKATGTAAKCSTRSAFGFQQTTGTATTLTFQDLPNGNYCAKVQTQSKTGLSSDSTFADIVPFRVGEIDTTAPFMTDVRMFEDNGTPAQVDTGDVIRIQFSESMKAITSGTEIRFKDNDQQVYKIVLSASNTSALGEATFTQTDLTVNSMTYTKGQLTLTLVDLPVKISGPGDDDIANLNATITQIKKGELPGAEDLEGNPLDISTEPVSTTSRDNVLDNE